MLDDLTSYAAHRGRKSGANETDYEDIGAEGVVVVSGSLNDRTVQF